jgi:alpha-ketoglutarate-dependent taurine dioxygenase
MTQATFVNPRLIAFCQSTIKEQKMKIEKNMAEVLEYNQSHFPTLIENNGEIQTLEDSVSWLSNNRAYFEKELLATGAILFRGFPVVDAESYEAFFSAFEYQNFTYKESLSNAVRINFTEFVFTANEAPKDVEIYLHNEMAQTPIYPNRISLFCESPAEAGGATAVCRSDLIYNELKSAHPELTEKLEKVGVKYSSRMPAEDRPESGQGRSWRSTLSVEDLEGAEAKLKELGYSWQWAENGDLKVQTGALVAVKTLEDGRKSFFNQLIAAYQGWAGVKENPSVALCFGDDSEIPVEFFKSAVAISDSLSFDVEWQAGDVVVVDNTLAMHGRRPFTGDKRRKVLVILGK